LTLLVPPALLAVVVGAGVLGGHGEVVPVPSPAAVARAVAAASANVAPLAPLAVRVVDPLAAAHAVDGEIGQTLIPYEWRPRLADRVDRFTIDDSVLLAAPRHVDRFTIDDSVFALATPPRRSDWPRAVASPYLR
jgi:hypothetical protein